MRFWFAVLALFAMRPLEAASVVLPICELPVKVQDGFVWLQVTVPETSEPLNFLLDSGASTSVLNLSIAQRLRLKLGRKVRVTGVGATLSGYWPANLSAKVGQFQLPGEYLVLDLNKLSRACDRSVDGLVGTDFFLGRVVQIDYAAQKLRIFDDLPHEAKATAVPMEVRSCGFRVAVNVNGGKPQWVRVDTGCATAFQWVTANVRPGRCATKPAVGLAKLSIPQTMTGVRVGNHFLDTVPTGLHRKAIFAGESGLLGNGFFANFGAITIDAKAGRLQLGRSSANCCNSRRAIRGFLMSLNNPLIPHCDSHHRNRFASRTSEVEVKPAISILISPLRQRLVP